VFNSCNGKHNGALPTRLTNSSGGWYRSTFVLSQFQQDTKGVTYKVKKWEWDRNR